jgi:apolipoprotein N-acyltransferase
MTPAPSFQAVSKALTVLSYYWPGSMRSLDPSRVKRSKKMLLATVAAILVGAGCTWPALFLYERVLLAMAYLKDAENSGVRMLVLLLFLARYAVGILWMASFILIFVGLPLHFFPAKPYLQPVLGYTLAFGVVLILRSIPVARRMRASGIAPEQRERPRIYRAGPR